MNAIKWRCISELLIIMESCLRRAQLMYRAPSAIDEGDVMTMRLCQLDQALSDAQRAVSNAIQALSDKGEETL